MVRVSAVVLPPGTNDVATSKHNTAVSTATLRGNILSGRGLMNEDGVQD